MTSARILAKFRSRYKYGPRYFILPFMQGPENAQSQSLTSAVPITYRQERYGSSFKLREPGSGRFLKPFLKEMYAKRLEVGPDKERRRSEWINWNYDCEIFSFGKRLGEDFNEGTLKQAFIHRSYLEEERRKRAELGIDSESTVIDLKDNSDLAKEGETLMSSYIKVYLRNVYPYMFEECISSVHDHLMKDGMLSSIAADIGCEELILSQDFPVGPATLSQTLKAVVGALVTDQGQERGESFVRDFVLTRLVGKDVNELWTLVNPMGLLVALMALTKRGLPEPRLLWSSAISDVLSLYWVGIYSDQQLISKAPGETLLIAEDMAARDAIRKLMRTEDHHSPLVFGLQGSCASIDYDRVNASASDILQKYYNSTESKELSA